MMTQEEVFAEYRRRWAATHPPFNLKLDGLLRPGELEKIMEQEAAERMAVIRQIIREDEEKQLRSFLVSRGIDLDKPLPHFSEIGDLK